MKEASAGCWCLLRTVFSWQTVTSNWQILLLSTSCLLSAPLSSTLHNACRRQIVSPINAEISQMSAVNGCSHHIWFCLWSAKRKINLHTNWHFRSCVHFEPYCVNPCCKQSSIIIECEYFSMEMTNVQPYCEYTGLTATVSTETSMAESSALNY